MDVCDREFGAGFYCENSHLAENLEVHFYAQIFDAADGEGSGVVPGGDACGVTGAGEGRVGVDGVEDGVGVLAEEVVEALLAVLIVCPGEHDEDPIVDDHSVVEVGVVLAGAE